MLKWLLTLVVALLLSGLLSHGLRRMGLDRLPGDFEFKSRNGRFVLPLASSLLLSALLGAFVFLV
ncbi:MAG: DUF2905 family protein [Thiobacillus sp.]|nr:DUF2905 family protein [Thiobacillus sp.]